MKTAAALCLLPAVTAFLAPAPKAARRTGAIRMAGEGEPGAVTWFPDSPAYWDPLKLSTTDEKFYQYRCAEVKHGRVAMLACADYLAKEIGWKLPGSLGETPIDSIPQGLAAVKAVPLEGWAQVLIFCSALELLAPQNPDRTPGHVQPDTAVFPVPGEPVMQTRELNNGRLAMISIAGIWAGESLTGGEDPLTTLSNWFQSLA